MHFKIEACQCKIHSLGQIWFMSKEFRLESFLNFKLELTFEICLGEKT